MGQKAVRAVTLTLIYAAVLFLCRWFAFELRFDFLVPPEFQDVRLVSIAINLPIKLLFLLFFRQFGSLLTYFSVPDLFRIAGAMLLANLTSYAIRSGMTPEISTPRGVILTDFVLSVGALSTLRLGFRIYRERLTSGHSQPGTAQQRIAIVGAGDAGATLAKEFISSPQRGFRPVMFFDDNAEKQGHLLHGIPIVGPPEMIDKLKESATITKVVIAMPSASAKRLRDVVLLMKSRGLKVETLPSIEELASGRVTSSRIRPVEVTDLLGRDAVKLDVESIRTFAEGKVVMVTGAGGSIGAELCRQIAGLNPQRLLMVEQSEGNLFNTEQELNETGLGGSAVPLVADVLDKDRMDFIFDRYRPSVVFHAAAHKHVFMMERQPSEAVRNNVFGTRALAELAEKHKVESFVFISTDKAINPTSVMGATKRLAELIIGQRLVGADPVAERASVSKASSFAGPTADKLAAEDPVVERAKRFAPNPEALAASATPNRTKFIAVRFGNVLGSSGSVIPIFKRQIANGGPVTVTHPDVTRYFMTIPEAVGLVLQASVLGDGGEIFVLDMGQPVKIADLAKQMIELSGFRVGEDIEIRYTGLKPGEKLYEELQHSSEAYAPTSHPRIMRFTSQSSLNEQQLHDLEILLHRVEPNEVKRLIQRMVPEYSPFLD